MVLGLEGMGIMAIVQSVLLVISALIIIVAAIGILRMDNDMPNVVYARIHILGMIDVAGIIAFLGLGQPLFALIYLFLAPLLAHALANAYFHGEDDFNNPVLNPALLNEEPLEASGDESGSDNGSNGESGSSQASDEEILSSGEESGSDNDSVEESQDSIEDADNKTTEEKDEENLESEGDDND